MYKGLKRPYLQVEFGRRERRGLEGLVGVEDVAGEG